MGAEAFEGPALWTTRTYLLALAVALWVWYLCGAAYSVARRLLSPPNVPDEPVDPPAAVVRAPVAAAPSAPRLLLLPVMVLFFLLAVVFEGVAHPLRSGGGALALARDLCRAAATLVASAGLKACCRRGGTLCAKSAGVVGGSLGLGLLYIGVERYLFPWLAWALRALGRLLWWLATPVVAMVVAVVHLVRPLVVAVAAALAAVWGTVVAVATAAWGAVVAVATAVWGTVVAVVAAVVDLVVLVVGPVVRTMVAVLVAVLGPVVAALAWVLRAVADLVGAVASVVLGILRTHGLALGVAAALVGAVVWRRPLGAAAVALARALAATAARVRAQLVEVGALVQASGGRVLLDPGFWFPVAPRPQRWGGRGRGGRRGGRPGSRGPARRGRGASTDYNDDGDDGEYRPPGVAGPAGRRAGSRGPRGGRRGSTSPNPTPRASRPRAASPGAGAEGPVPAGFGTQGEGGWERPTPSPWWKTEGPSWETTQAPSEWPGPTPPASHVGYDDDVQFVEGPAGAAARPRGGRRGRGAQ
jgi:hypothetical protein